MDIETIKEMWELTEGGEMPREFLNTVNSFIRHKSAFHQTEFTESDFAACVMNYKLYMALGKRISKSAKESVDGK